VLCCVLLGAVFCSRKLAHVPAKHIETVLFHRRCHSTACMSCIFYCCITCGLCVASTGALLCVGCPCSPHPTCEPAGHIPSNAWLSAYFSASRHPAVLADLDPLALDKTLTGLAAVGSELQQGIDLPQDWVHSIHAASLHLLPGANLISIANMLQAAGQLALPLSPVWLAAAMARVQLLLGQAGFVPVGYHHPSAHRTIAGPSNSSNDSSSSREGGVSGSAGSSRRHVRTVQGATSSISSSGSGISMRRSMVLSARMERGWTRVCLQRVLLGLRSQEMLNSAAQRKLWFRAQDAAAAAAAGGDRGVFWDSPAPAAAAAAAGGAHHFPSGSGGSSSSVPGGSDALSVWPWLVPAVYGVWPDKQSAQQALATLAR
jgi:hypothetical protein